MRPFGSRPFFNAPKHRINGKIRAREVRVIGPDGKQVGVLGLAEAIRLAQSLGLDLVEIAPEAVPAVCRLVDYGKFLYEQAKKEKKSPEASRGKLKEIQLRPTIDAHDYETKLNHARDFLEEGMQVKVSLRFRGRELRHPEQGEQVVAKFVSDLAAVCRTDAPPKRVDRSINVILRPLARQQRGKTDAPHPAPPPPRVPPASSANPPPA